MHIYTPLSNKYYKWYIAIISLAKNRNWTKETAPCYVENHHIIPKSLGGRAIKQNRVYLTAKEHYVVHKLLTKCYDGVARFKMLKAFNSMFWVSPDHGPKFVRSCDYAIIKQKISEAMQGPLNHQYIDGRKKINRQKIRKPKIKYKLVQLVSPQGEYFYSCNLNQFCKQYNLNQGNMSRVIRDLLPQHKGWTGKYQ